MNFLIIQPFLKIQRLGGGKHSEYETKILEIYGPKRGTSPYTMTDATKRYNNLKDKL